MEMRRFTLRFEDRALERAFQRYDPEARLASARALIIFVTLVGTAESLYRLIFEEGGSMTLFRGAILLVYGVLAAAYFASFHIAVVMASGRAYALAMPLLAGGAIVHVAFAGAALSKVVFCVFFVLLIGNVGIPYSHMFQHALGLTLLLAFVLLPKATLSPTEVEATFVYLFFAIGVASIVVNWPT